MTQKQLKFCKLYATGLDAGECALQAGYADKASARALLAHPKVLVQIAALQQEAAITPDFVLTHLVTILQNCMGEAHYDAKTALRVLELLGKHVSLFEGHAPVQSNDGVLREILQQVSR